MFEYPFGEFADHVRAMIVVRDYESVRLDYSTDRTPVHVGDARDGEANLFRMLDYLAQVIEDREERAYKGARLYGALAFAAANLERFRDADLVRGGDEPAMVPPYLFQAVHHFFCGDSPREDVTPEEVIAKAREFQSEDSA